MHLSNSLQKPSGIIGSSKRETHPEAAGNEGGLRGSAEDSGLPTPGPWGGDQKSEVLTNQWIGLRENLQENPIFSGKIYGFLQIFP